MRAMLLERAGWKNHDQPVEVERLYFWPGQVFEQHVDYPRDHECKM
jgi:hypothetical protein